MANKTSMCCMFDGSAIVTPIFEPKDQFGPAVVEPIKSCIRVIIEVANSAIFSNSPIY